MKRHEITSPIFNVNRTFIVDKNDNGEIIHMYEKETMSPVIWCDELINIARLELLK